RPGRSLRACLEPTRDASAGVPDDERLAAEEKPEGRDGARAGHFALRQAPRFGTVCDHGGDKPGLRRVLQVPLVEEALVRTDEQRPAVRRQGDRARPAPEALREVKGPLDRLAVSK